MPTTSYQPVKPWRSIAQQIALLEERGLAIEDRAVAEQWLSAVGYYRLSGYWYPFRELGVAPGGGTRGRRLDTFVPGTSFSEVVGLYEFDRHLKAEIQSAMERIEVAVRSQIGHRLGAIDPMAHTDRTHFRTTFNHPKWYELAEKRVARARGRDEFVDHHDAVYGGHLPIWVLTDVLDFSDLSKLFAGMNSADQQVIADWFGVHRAPAASRKQRENWLHKHPLGNWLEHLTIVRNICAHHGRLWNRLLTPIGVPRVRHLSVFDSVAPGQQQVERVYGTICVITHLLEATSPGNSWRTKIDALVDRSFADFTLRSSHEMGYPTCR